MILLEIVQSIVRNSTSPEAKDFDASMWLSKWLVRPQPALGGRAPEELLDEPGGLEVVARLIGAIESGAFQ